jgi:hypothetical protein
MTINVAFLLIFLALQVLDIATTLKALKLGGREVNPVLAKAFNYADPLAVMVVVKLAGVWALWYLDNYFITGLLCAVYLWVVDRNLAVVKKLQGN